MRTLLRVAWIAAAGVVAASGTSSAGLVRVEFSGTIDTIGVNLTAAQPNPPPPEVALGDSVRIGAPFSGYFTFDDAAPPTETSLLAPNIPSATYQFNSPAFTLHLELGTYVGDSSYSIAVVDADSSKVYPGENGPGVVSDEIFGNSIPEALGIPPSLSFSFFGTPIGLPLSSTSLHNVPWNLHAFPLAKVEWGFETPEGYEYFPEGIIQTLVPEPGTASLATIALLIATRGFRRARS